MLASGSLWVFFFFFSFALAAYRVAYTHTHTHTGTQQSVSISFHLYTFLFALATCFPAAAALPLPSLPACLPACRPANLLIYYIFFFLLLAPFTFAVVSAFSCSVRVLFVYASFWFSQLKLYLLFLFSLVIPGTVSWIWVLLLQDWESALVSRLPFFSALYSFCVFVLLVESSPAKFICVLVYTFSCSVSSFSFFAFFVVLCLNLCGRNLFKFMWLLSNWFQC